MGACVGAVVFAVAISGLSPETYTLRTEDPVWDVALEDVDGDGTHDVIAFCVETDSDPPKKYLALFLSGGTHRYGATPSLRITLDPEFGTAFVAEVDGQPPREIVVASHSKAIVYRYEEETMKVVGETTFASILPSGSREPAFLKDAVSDLDGDGVDEWLIPVPMGCEIRRMDGLVRTVPCDVRGEMSVFGGRAVYYRLPTHRTFDVPEQSEKAIAFLTKDYIDFVYGAQWAERTRIRIPGTRSDEWETNVLMEDIDGNGLPDLVITRSRGTVNLSARTEIYLAKKAYSFSSTPDSVIETKGALTLPTLADVNGDGRLDIVFTGFPINVRSILNYFMRKKITIRLEVHLFESGGYAAKSTYRRNFLADVPEGREQVAFTAGDFDGDGIRDAAFGRSGEELAIYLGSARNFLNASPSVVLDMPAFGVARHKDLDNNGREDIVMFHPAGEHDKRIEVILF